MDWLVFLEVQGTLKSLLQHHSSKASILQHSAFSIVQLSHPYMTTEKTIALTRWTLVGKVMSLLFSMISRLVITFFIAFSMVYLLFSSSFSIFPNRMWARRGGTVSLFLIVVSQLLVQCLIQSGCSIDICQIINLIRFYSHCIHRYVYLVLRASNTRLLFLINLFFIEG